MNNPEPISESLPVAAPKVEADELREYVDSLRHTLVSALVLIVVISGTFNIYLWRQFRHTRAELKVLSAQAPQIAAELSGMQDFARKMADFGRTHPDFVPILTKYGLKPTPAPTSAP